MMNASLQNQLTPQSYGLGAVGVGSLSQINEPTFLGHANNILNYLSGIEEHLTAIDADVFGKGGTAPQMVNPTNLAGLLAQISERSASICGWLGTMRGSFGCMPPAPAPEPNRR